MMSVLFLSAHEISAKMVRASIRVWWKLVKKHLHINHMHVSLDMIIPLREMIVLQLLLNLHSYVCETYMHVIHTHVSESCVRIRWGL
jgi:hypothetical protein